MAKALIRLEDIGPGGYYETAENQQKLLVIADYLYSRQVPFHVAVISRFIDPLRGIDHSIGNPFDPIASRFRYTLHALAARGASLGMHGYTHQFGHCPPDDPPECLSTNERLYRSYAYSRYSMALSAFHAARLLPDWWETPHYAASEVQRRILEACSWLIYEANPDAPDSRQVTHRKSNLVRGKTYYVPTPLGYVGGATVEQDVKRMINLVHEFGDDDLASFFYHPFLEFPYIHIRSKAFPYYEEGSPLKILIQHILSQGRRFVRILDL